MIQLLSTPLLSPDAVISIRQPVPAIVAILRFPSQWSFGLELNSVAGVPTRSRLHQCQVLADTGDTSTMLADVISLSVLKVSVALIWIELIPAAFACSYISASTS